jgi:hypothetical protein
MFVTIRKMSDIEDTPGVTSVNVEKPVKQKKPRTEAQKKATAKALEALADHRAKKYAEKEAEVAKTPKGRTAHMPVVTAPKPIPNHPEPTSPAPLKYEEDIKLLREELADLKKKKAKKPVKKVKVYVSESDDDSDEEEEEVEEVVVRGKKTHMPKRVVRKAKEPEPEYDNRRELIESIFFRNS